MPRMQLQFISMNYLPVTTAGPFPAENRCVYVIVLSLWNTTSTQSDPLFPHTDQQQPVTAPETGFRCHSQRCKRINGSLELREGEFFFKKTLKTNPLRQPSV